MCTIKLWQELRLVFVQPPSHTIKLNRPLLALQLIKAEQRVLELPTCECRSSCIVNGTAKLDGEIWASFNATCEDCTCTNGEVICKPRSCAVPNCKYPAQPDLSKGECCPTCLSESQCPNCITNM